MPTLGLPQYFVADKVRGLLLPPVFWPFCGARARVPGLAKLDPVRAIRRRFISCCAQSTRLYLLLPPVFVLGAGVGGVKYSASAE